MSKTLSVSTSASCLPLSPSFDTEHFVRSTPLLSVVSFPPTAQFRLCVTSRRTANGSKMAFTALLVARPVVASLGGAAVLLVVWIVFSTLRQYLRLRHIKGPALAGFSQWWLVRAVGGGRTHLDLFEVCEKYGMCHD